MIGTYISAALACAASLLVGRAILAALGRESWSWLEPAVGLAALFTVAGFFARAPGHATGAAVFVALMAIAAVVVVRRTPYRYGDALRTGLPVALITLALLSIPFAVSGRHGLIGVGFNNDLGLHLAWAEWLKDGLGPTPAAGYPLGPHGLATTLAELPGIGLDQAFTGLVLAISILTALTALAGLGELGKGRRLLAAVLVALPYLAVSYFAQSAFKETAEALFALAFAIALPAAWPLPPERAQRLRALGPLIVLLGGIVFSYSFAGLAWPAAAVAIWSLSLPAVRAALSPRRLLRALARPAVLVGIAVLAGAALVLGLVGPFGFAKSFAEVQGANTFGTVSPAEALGFWTSSNYRLDTAGGATLPWLTSAIAALALVAGLAWWLGRRDFAVPAALAGGVAIYLLTLNPLSGEYVRAKALMIVAPLVMLIAVRALLSSPLPGWRVPRGAWAALGAVFIAGAAYSSLLVLRDTPVAPPGHGAELREFADLTAGRTVLYAGQDRFAQWELRGSDPSIPLIEFGDDQVQERSTKPFDTGVSYSPIDFDSFSIGTLDRFDFVVTTRAAYASKAPPNFRTVRRTPSYVLWKRTGPTARNRRTLLEGGAPAELLDCSAPEVKIFISRPGTASTFPTPVVGPKESWDAGARLGLGEETSQTLSLPAGRWNLSLQYFSPVPLELRAPGAGLTTRLEAALDGQRPNQLSLFNDGQYWPAGSIRLGAPSRLRFTISVDEPSTLQRISDYGGNAYVGELTARPVGPERTMPLPPACGTWVDFYSGAGQR
ncbi:MAG: hypothetical protein AABM29_01665 [Actinomycetota bacterium]